MKKEQIVTGTASRRSFLGTSAFGAAVGATALANPGLAAAQSVGVKRADLPDLTIKQVKTYEIDYSGIHRLNGTEGDMVAIVTESGLEGNYILGNRSRTDGWLEWAKAVIVGKNVIDLLPMITSTSGMQTAAGYGARTRGGSVTGVPRAALIPNGPLTHGVPPPNGSGINGGFGVFSRSGGTWPNYHAAAAEICMWDVLGKSVNRPVYKILGGTKDRMLAYASSQHLPTVEDYVPDVLKAKEQGFKAYKIHPGLGQHGKSSSIPSYIGHMEEIKQVRKAVGDEFVLAHDPVQAYNRYEAMKVGRLLDELNYAWFEDPIRTTDFEGLVQLCSALDLPIHVGEFLASISDFADYISKGALDVARLIADNVGGISGSMRVGLLADAFGLECTPHNWGNVIDLAVHFHIELALPNAYWFEMPFPFEYADRPYHRDKFRMDKEGYVMAPTEAGLGYPIDRDALDKIVKRVAT